MHTCARVWAFAHGAVSGVVPATCPAPQALLDGLVDATPVGVDPCEVAQPILAAKSLDEYRARAFGGGRIVDRELDRIAGHALEV